MARLSRFEEFRYVGTRDTMRFYDCDDSDQFSALQSRAESDDLLNRKLLCAFGPDDPAEARNRGFRPAGPPSAR